MALFQESTPDDLHMTITGNLTPEQNFLRMPMLDTLTSVIPKDPKIQLLVFHGEVRSGGDIPWHIHLGPIITVVMQGEMIFQLEDQAFHYKANDVFLEPVGVVHRAYNPNPDVTLAAMCIQLTPEGHDHIINVGTGPTEDMPMTAPQGPTFPMRAGGLGKLVGS
jgi:quercetin dioxygenase-like cupin family protein